MRIKQDEFNLERKAGFTAGNLMNVPKNAHSRAFFVSRAIILIAIAMTLVLPASAEAGFFDSLGEFKVSWFGGIFGGRNNNTAQVIRGIERKHIYQPGE